MVLFRHLALGALVALGAAIGLMLLSLYVLYNGHFPIYSRTVVFVSPLVPFGVAVAAFCFYLVRTDINPGRMMGAFVCMMLVFFLCALLSHPESFSQMVLDGSQQLGVAFYSLPNWSSHVVLLLLLYVVFIIWDAVFAWGEDVPLDLRRDARRSLAFLNVPTCGALVLLLVFLHYWQHSASLDSIWLDVNTYGFETIFDVFVSGIVAFHLTVGAVIFVVIFVIKLSLFIPSTSNTRYQRDAGP
jgi:hypothetical protein